MPAFRRYSTVLRISQYCKSISWRFLPKRYCSILDGCVISQWQCRLERTYRSSSDKVNNMDNVAGVCIDKSFKSRSSLFVLDLYHIRQDYRTVVVGDIFERDWISIVLSCQNLLSFRNCVINRDGAVVCWYRCWYELLADADFKKSHHGIEQFLFT